MVYGYCFQGLLHISKKGNIIEDDQKVEETKIRMMILITRGKQGSWPGKEVIKSR